MTDLKQLGQQAKEASYTLGLMDTRQKNTLLNKMAAAIEANAPRILQANVLDLEKNGSQRWPRAYAKSLLYPIQLGK